MNKLDVDTSNKIVKLLNKINLRSYSETSKLLRQVSKPYIIKDAIQKIDTVLKNYKDDYNNTLERYGNFRAQQLKPVEFKHNIIQEVKTFTKYNNVKHKYKNINVIPKTINNDLKFISSLKRYIKMKADASMLANYQHFTSVKLENYIQNDYLKIQNNNNNNIIFNLKNN